MGGTEIEKSQLDITVGIKNPSERGSSASPNDDSEDDGILLRADVRPAAERSLVRKMDMRLLPTIILIFIMNYIDVRTTSVDTALAMIYCFCLS